MKNLRWIIAAAIVINTSLLSAKGNITFGNDIINNTISVQSMVEDLLTIKGEAVEVKITDVNGNVISSYTLDETAKTHHFDISSLAKGEYKCVMISKTKEVQTTTFQKS
ncbi:MAG: T9SS type A sorting domain-containing protein [Flavobacteriales bacterium]